jgi:hypothetical protein
MGMSTYQEVVDLLAEVDRNDDASHDPERAHGDEDAAMEKALRAVAAGDPDSQRIAAAVVAHLDAEKTRIRWYA